MEPLLLGERLKKGCEMCVKCLQLSECVDEKRNGLAITFCIKCECGYVTDVLASKSHRASGSARVFDVNSKTSVGVINAPERWSCSTQHSCSSNELNIPPICPKTLKRRKSDMGPIIESMAKRNCRRAADAEAEWQLKTREA